MGKGGISGGDVNIVEVAKRWEANGNVVNFVTNQYGAKLIHHKWNHKSVLAIKTPSFLDRVYGSSILATFITQIWTVFNVIKALHSINHLDISIAASTSLPDTVGLLLSRAKISKAMFMHHFISPPMYRMKLGFSFRNAMTMFVWNQIAYVVAKISRWLVLAGYTPPFLRAEFNPTLVVEIDYGAPIDTIDHIKPASETYKGVYLGRLAFNKGILDLVDIWRSIVADFPSARLGIIGTGNSHVIRMLEHKIKRTGLEHNIRLLGFLSDSKKYGLLKSSKIFVYPSYEEGFGIVIIEAMACGLPIVCYDLTAYFRFSKPLLLAKIGNKQGLANHITCLLKDENKRKDISKECIATARKYNWGTIASKVLKNILDHRSSRTLPCAMKNILLQYPEHQERQTSRIP